MVAQCISESDILSNPPDPLFKGAIRAYGLSIAAWLSLPANSGPASDDALLFHWDSVPMKYKAEGLVLTGASCCRTHLEFSGTTHEAQRVSYILSII